MRKGNVSPQIFALCFLFCQTRKMKKKQLKVQEKKITCQREALVIVPMHCGWYRHCAHNCNQPYDEIHQGHWFKFKFGFPKTGKGSPKFFEIGWQTPEIHKILYISISIRINWTSAIYKKKLNIPRFQKFNFTTRLVDTVRRTGMWTSIVLGVALRTI